jgi:hypothetical protein
MGFRQGTAKARKYAKARNGTKNWQAASPLPVLSFLSNFAFSLIFALSQFPVGSPH